MTKRRVGFRRRSAPAAIRRIRWMRSDAEAQSRQARRSKLPPLLPALVVAGGVGEAIAVGFGFRQGRVVDHKHAAHPPEDSDAGPTASGACARHCAALTEPKDAFYHIFPLGGHIAMKLEDNITESITRVCDEYGKAIERYDYCTGGEQPPEQFIASYVVSGLADVLTMTAET